MVEQLGRRAGRGVEIEGVFLKLQRDQRAVAAAALGDSRRDIAVHFEPERAGGFIDDPGMIARVGQVAGAGQSVFLPLGELHQARGAA